MGMFIQDYYLMFMIVLLSLSILILLRTIVGTFIQIAYFALTVFVYQFEMAMLTNVLLAVQVAIGVILIYQLKKAIDYNFDLVFEKTHLIDRNYTKTDYSGSKKSFFF